MKTKRLTTWVMAGGFIACTPGKIDDRFITADNRAPIIRSWNLVAADEQALADPLIPGSRYPNMGEYDRVTVSLHSDALLCGDFQRGAESIIDACGGPADGLPYFVVPLVDEEKLTLRVVDIFGNEVVTSNPIADTCLFPSGRCRLCSNGSGEIVEDDCLLAEGSGAVDEPGEGDESSTLEVDESCYVQGARAFIDYANRALDDIDMPRWTVNPEALTRPTNGEGPIQPPSNVSVVRVGVPRAMHAVDNICDAYGAGQLRLGASPLVEDYRLAGNRVRCGFLANDALITGCDAETAACAGEQRFDYELGLLAAHNAWTGGDGRGWGYEQAQASSDCGLEDPDCEPEEQSPGPECVGSPLIVSTDDDPVSLLSSSAGVRFDLTGTGILVHTGWVDHGAFVVLDRNFNGHVDSGRELFGDATLRPNGKLAPDGIAALADYDRAAFGGNDDGAIDARDLIYRSLLLWTDRNHDGRSEPHELASLADRGLVSISLAGRKVSASPISPVGNYIGLETLATRTDGGQTPVYDVWFRYTTSANPVLLTQKKQSR